MQHSAGLLIVSGDRLLLLKRARSTGNGGTWGLPGGRLEFGESRYQGACRETAEEVARVPDHRVADRVCVPRNGRRYDVFICRARRRLRRRWVPDLNHEHTAFRWADLAWCRRNRDRLHPVVRALVEDRSSRRRIRAIARRPR